MLCHYIIVFHFEGILPKGPYLPCVSMAGRALLAGYHRFLYSNCTVHDSLYDNMEMVPFDILHWSTGPHQSYRTVFWTCAVLVLNVIMCAFYQFLYRMWLHHGGCDYHWNVISTLFWATHLGFPKLVLTLHTSLDVFAPGYPLWILDWTCYLQTPLCHV